MDRKLGRDLKFHLRKRVLSILEKSDFYLIARRSSLTEKELRDLHYKLKNYKQVDNIQYYFNRLYKLPIKTIKFTPIAKQKQALSYLFNKYGVNKLSKEENIKYATLYNVYYKLELGESMQERTIKRCFHLLRHRLT